MPAGTSTPEGALPFPRAVVVVGAEYEKVCTYWSVRGDATGLGIDETPRWRVDVQRKAPAVRRKQGIIMGDSLDESLNKNAKNATGQRAVKTWVIAIVAVIVVAALAIVIIAEAATNGGGKGADVASGGAAGSAAADADSAITVGEVLSPTNLDIRTEAGSALEQLLIGNVYEGLTSRDESNDVAPGLAESWDVSDDGLTYTFHLHDNAAFSNGDALDSEDVVWSVNELIDNKYNGYATLSAVKSVEADGADTVVFTLSQPNSDLLWNLSGRAGLVYDKDADYDYKTQAVGSGPYLLDSFTANDSAVLKINENYWGTDHKASVATVTLHYYSDTTSGVNALRSGDIQVLSAVDAQQVDSLKSEGFEAQPGDGTDKFVLAFNNKRKPLDDKRVRQAIRYALDEDEIIASRGGNDAALGGPIPSLDPGYEDLTDLYPHDLDKARELLAEAGYGEGNPLALTLTVPSIYQSELSDQVASQLGDAGIDVTVNQVEFSTWLSDVYTNGDYDLSIVDHAESHDFANWANPDYYFGYDSEDVQDDYAAALAATDDETRDKHLADAARTVSEDAAADWLFNYRVITAWDPSVKDFPLNMNQSYLPLWQVSVES